jgi:CheY-like chemotaxis protein
VTPGDYTLLIVDDSDDNRAALTRRLAREGYTRVMTANDGRHALDLLAAQPVDLVLLDIMMPELNGYEVLERLNTRALRNGKSLDLSDVTFVSPLMANAPCRIQAATDLTRRRTPSRRCKKATISKKLLAVGLPAGASMRMRLFGGMSTAAAS